MHVPVLNCGQQMIYTKGFCLNYLTHGLIGVFNYILADFCMKNGKQFNELGCESTVL